ASYLLVSAAITVSGGEPALWLARFAVAILLLFPYLVLMFANSFRPFRRTLRRGAGVLAAAVVLPVFTLQVGASPPAWMPAYIVLILAYWFTLSLAASTVLWKAGKGQPTVARCRMRLMSLATIFLASALLLSGVSGLSE